MRTSDTLGPGRPTVPSRERVAWIARNLIPNEAALRAWLRQRGVIGARAEDVVLETYAVFAGLASVDHLAEPPRHIHEVALLILQNMPESPTVVVGAFAANDASPTAAPRDPDHPVAETIAALPRSFRETLMQRKVEGLSQREIALRRGLSERAVEAQVTVGFHALLTGFGRQSAN